MILKKSTIEAIVTGVLVVVLVVLVLTKLAGRERPRNPESEIRNPKLTHPPPELLARIESLKVRARQIGPKIKKKQKERASLPWGRDPFRIAESAIRNPQSAIGRPPLVCRGIAYTAGGPVALINLAVVREGETIKGYLVEQIAKDRVVLTKGGKSYVLRIGEE